MKQGLQVLIEFKVYRCWSSKTVQSQALLKLKKQPLTFSSIFCWIMFLASISDSVTALGLFYVWGCGFTGRSLSEQNWPEVFMPCPLFLLPIISLQYISASVVPEEISVQILHRELSHQHNFKYNHQNLNINI